MQALLGKMLRCGPKQARARKDTLSYQAASELPGGPMKGWTRWRTAAGRSRAVK